MTAARVPFAIAIVTAVLPLATAEVRPATLPQTEQNRFEEFYTSGRLAAGEAALVEWLRKSPDDENARFSLGMLQFLRSVEHLVQSLHHHGLRSDIPGAGMFLLIPRSPLPPNPNPKPPAYADIRKLTRRFVDDLARAEATLALVKSPDVKLPLKFGLIRLDLNGDGKATDEETLWRLYALFNRAVEAKDAENFLIAFDLADALWLRGYCHLLMAFGEIALAHDATELFQRAGHLVFTKIETPHSFLLDGKPVFEYGGVDIMDWIAFVHCSNFPLTEPAGMTRALRHLEAMIGQSRRMWTAIAAEVDDDHEWIPSPKQTGVIPNVTITAEMVAGWQDFLNEAEALLAGTKLIPFWRTSDDRGVNLRRVFTEARRFDLVLWIQGTGATPFLERGTLTKEETWRRFERIFRGEFIGFAIWFN